MKIFKIWIFFSTTFYHKNILQPVVLLLGHPYPRYLTHYTPRKSFHLFKDFAENRVTTPISLFRSIQQSEKLPSRQKNVFLFRFVFLNRSVTFRITDIALKSSIANEVLNRLNVRGRPPSPILLQVRVR